MNHVVEAQTGLAHCVLLVERGQYIAARMEFEFWLTTSSNDSTNTDFGSDRARIFGAYLAACCFVNRRPIELLCRALTDAIAPTIIGQAIEFFWPAVKSGSSGPDAAFRITSFLEAIGSRPVAISRSPQTAIEERKMSSEHATVDRATVRRMVEEFWRLLVLHGYQWGQAHPTLSRAEIENQYRDRAQDMSRQFTERMHATAALMTPEHANIFLQMVDEEDSICFVEQQRNPEAFHRRLGLEFTPASPVRATGAYRRQGIREMVIRTAVRATIWEAVFSLFR